MKKFRRSTKSEKSDGKPGSISIPQKDAIAIVPPKKVIKAIYDYKVQHPEQNPAYLSFQQGDFLHVVRRENDPDWYEACNPLQNTRGLVPVNFFETVGKTAGQNGDFGSPGAVPPNAAHDSGYSEKNGDGNGFKNISDPAPAPTAASRMSSTMGRGSGAMVYGIVQYDFNAERPDELDAKAGEYIIVIALSTPDWFVAKPITRLGGPGLIPVSFIEIRDMVTGKAVTDTQAAVQKARIPRVEDWKKMAADYKNNSITLGRLDTESSQNLSRSMERLSMNSRRSREMNGNGIDGRPPHLRNGSSYQSSNVQYQHRMSQLAVPVRAQVPRYIHSGEQYSFVVESVTEDGRHWELSRTYQDFYNLQMALKQNFPEEAGDVPGHKRILPLMPGPVPYVSDAITAGRCKHLNDYLKDLLQLEKYIVASEHVRLFFAQREGDYELDPDAEENGYRLSTASRQSQTSTTLPSSTLPQSSSQNLSAQQSMNQNWGLPQRGQQLQSSPYGASPNKQPPAHYRYAPDLRPPQKPPPMLRNNSSLTQTSATSQGTGISFASNNTTNPPGAMKIKVWFGESNCVVIRLPADFNYAGLLQKLRDRWALEPGFDPSINKDDVHFIIEYKDESTAMYYHLKSDEDLDTAMQRNEKLTLRVTPVQGMV